MDGQSIPTRSKAWSSAKQRAKRFLTRELRTFHQPSDCHFVHRDDQAVGNGAFAAVQSVAGLVRLQRSRRALAGRAAKHSPDADHSGKLRRRERAARALILNGSGRGLSRCGSL